MKERPILFSGPMVKAILEGRKTQTRRVMKPQPSKPPYPHIFPSGCNGWMSATPHEYGLQMAHFCPYGQPGDKFYIKEVHRITWDVEGEILKVEYKFPYEDDGAVRYYDFTALSKATQAKLLKIRTWGKWRNARFMYRFLARIWRGIVSVRPERLQEISIDDLAAEGVDLEEGIAAAAFNEAEHAAIGGCPLEHYPEIYGFAALWDSINGKRHPWASNPWVWRIEFRMLS